MRSIFHFRHIFGVPVSQQELDKSCFAFVCSAIECPQAPSLKNTASEPIAERRRDHKGIQQTRG